MDFRYSDKVEALRGRLLAFMDEHVYPSTAQRDAFLEDPANLWKP